MKYRTKFLGVLAIFLASFAGSCGNCGRATYHVSGSVKDDTGSAVSGPAQLCAQLTPQKWDPSGTHVEHYCDKRSYDGRDGGCTACWDGKDDVVLCNPDMYCKCPGAWVDQSPETACADVDIVQGSFSVRLVADTRIGDSPSLTWKVFLRFNGSYVPVSGSTTPTPADPGDSCAELEATVTATVPTH